MGSVQQFQIHVKKKQDSCIVEAFPHSALSFSADYCHVLDVFTVTRVAVQPTACQVCLTSEQKVAFLRPAITCGWLAPPAYPAGALLIYQRR